MGIPRFFTNLINKYDDLIDTSVDVDYFFIDFNAVIYDVLKTGNNGNDYSELEFNLIESVIVYLRSIITYVGPKKLVYIAMDGVAPMAKIVKQRARRYKSVIEQNYKKKLREKHNIPEKELKWSTSSISPGTIFMDKLCKKITACINNKFFGNGCEVLFSSCYEKGEGEHKIMNYLRSKACDKVVIMTPDNDMIVLAAMLDTCIHILKKKPDNETEFIYLSIDKCKKEFCKEMNEANGNEVNGNELEVKNYLLDYVFLTFMCGNDFVCSNYFLKIKEKGLEILIGIYNEIKKNESGFLIVGDDDGRGSIDKEFFKKIVEQLALVEQGQGRKIKQKIDRVRKSSSSNTNYEEMSPFDKDFAIYQHTEYYNPIHPEHEIYNKLFDVINYYDDKWKEQYNKFYFGGNDGIDDVCKNYMDSLQFCLNYYLGKIDWNFYYKYRSTPTFHDLLHYLNKDKKIVDNNNNNNDSLTPFEQLLIILPRNYKFLLPKVIGSELEHLFFKLDIVHGTKFIYSEPILPDIDIEKVKRIVKDNYSKLSYIEKNRNRCN
jgi:5'-3' exonuclease